MARNADTHPEPDAPSNPAPKFPPGAAGARTVTPPRPDVIQPNDPAPSPARAPFPDHIPDPGVSKQ